MHFGMREDFDDDSYMDHVDDLVTEASFQREHELRKRKADIYREVEEDMEYEPITV